MNHSCRNLLLAAVALMPLLTTAAGEQTVKWGRADVQHKKGAFLLKNYARRIYSNTFPVDSRKTYVLSGEFRTTGKANLISFGMELFDGQKNALASLPYTAIPHTGTTLTADAAKGAKQLRLKNCSRWQVKLYKLAVAETVNASGGKTQLTLRVSTIRKKKDGFILFLAAPLPCDLPAGTAIRQHGEAPPFNVTCDLPIAGNRWYKFEHVIRAGEGFSIDSDHFWPGTRYARIFVSAPVGEPMRFRNIKFRQVTGKALTAAVKRHQSVGKRFVPFKKCRRIARKGLVPIYSCQAHGGIRHEFASIPADKIKQLEALVAADKPGMLTFELFGKNADGSPLAVVKYASPIPSDNKPHWVIIKPEILPREPGAVINRIDLCWRNFNGTRLSVDRFRVLEHQNLIPGAVNIPRNTIDLKYAVGSRRYTLRWVDGKNPGVTIEWFDRNNAKVGTTTLPAGEESLEFTSPEQLVRGQLTLHKSAAGYPELSEIGQTREWQGNWIWITPGTGYHYTTAWFEKEFELPDAPIDSAILVSSADDRVQIFVNGKDAGIGGTHVQSKLTDLSKLLKPGKNVITFCHYNGLSWGGVIADLFVRSGGREHTIVTDGSWKFAIGKKRPARIDKPAVVLGDGKLDRWVARLDYCYRGPWSIARVTETGKNRFSVRMVKGQMPELPAFLTYKITSPAGVARGISLNTRVTRNGDIWHFDYSPPYPVHNESGILRLDDARLRLEGDPELARLAPAPARKPGISSARYITVNSRRKLEINGREHPIAFWAFPALFQKAYTSRSELIHAATTAGFDSFALVTDFVEFWKAPEVFDFSHIDNKVEQILSMNPNAKFLLQIGCYMPDWWLNQNPDDATARENGTPRHPMQERQALASKRWLKDARIPLKALIEHIRNSTWGDRVWGANVAENTNWEWFWWTGRNVKFYVSGYSKSDYASYHAFLRRRYPTDRELAEAWGIPGLTLEKAKMPSEAKQLSGTIGILLDAAADRSLIDWFDFRNQVIAEAVIDLCRSIKEFTGNRWLTGAYYGYYVNQCTNTGSHSIHSAGHNGFWEVANSPYVDYIRAPAIYRMRRLGLPDGNQAPQHTFLQKNKVVYIECDMRSALRVDPYCTDIHISRPATIEQTMDIMNRIFGMILATGCSHYWYDINCGAYVHPVLTTELRRQREILESLPPVKGHTPCEIAVAGDRDSVYYTMHNNNTNSLLPGIALPLVEHFPRIGAPFKMLSNADLLDGTTAPCRFYVMYTSFMLSKKDREALMKRFEAEKASVLWLYAPGAFYPTAGPDPAFCADFLGLKMRMDNTVQQPVIKFESGWNAPKGMSSRRFSPWFYPVSGYDEVIGRDAKGDPVLVSVKHNGATHYVSTLPNLPVEAMREMARRAGVHLYTASTNDVSWIGNDVVFLHTATGGKKKITLPPGLKLKKLVGPIWKQELRSGEEWEGEACRTYGFLVEKE